MRIDFEELYENTPFVCRRCESDCSTCPYGGDVFISAQVDELLLRKALREQEILRAERALNEINQQLEQLRTR